MTRNELIKLISNESLLFFPAIKDAITRCNEIVEKPKFSPLQMLALSYIGISNRKINNDEMTAINQRLYDAYTMYKQNML